MARTETKKDDQIETLQQGSRTADWFVRQKQHLYQIEARLRERKAQSQNARRDPPTRKPRIVTRIHKALVKLKQSGRYLPKSLLGHAMDYAFGQWKALIVFLEGCRIQIDNNLKENAIRPTGEKCDDGVGYGD